MVPEHSMSDFGTLKRKYQQLRELRESKAYKEPDRKVTPPPKKKPAAPPRVRPTAPIPAAELGQGSKLQLRHELAKAGIGLGADDPDDPNLLEGAGIIIGGTPTSESSVKKIHKKMPSVRNVKTTQLEEMHEETRQLTPRESLRAVIDGAQPIKPDANHGEAGGVVTIKPEHGNVFMNNLPRFVGHVEICRSFSRFGEIQAVYLVDGRGCGYLQFSDPFSAQKAVTQMNNALFCGVKIHLEEGSRHIPPEAVNVYRKEDVGYKPGLSNQAGKRSNPVAPPRPPPRKQQQRMVAYDFD